MSKANYKKVNRLTPTQKGYMAALIDGEGTITLMRIKSKESYTFYRRLAITISSGELELLREVKKIVGVGKITKKQPYTETSAISYTFQLTSQQALDLTAQIYPHLRTYKKGRAKLALKEYKKVTPRNGKYSLRVLKRKRGFVKKFFAIIPSNKARQIPRFL